MIEILIAIIILASKYHYIKSKFRERKLLRNAKQTKLQQQDKSNVQNPA